MEEKHPQDVKIDLPQDVAKGTYSNLVLVTHSATEVVFDFAQMLPGTGNSIVRDRIVMNPIHAKRFLHALMDNIQKYEKNFGQIVEPHGQYVPKPDDHSNHDDRNGNLPFDMNPMGDA